MIKAENLKKTYPGKVPTPALKGVTFEIQRGEFVAVMGRSGSGKSTLLHQLGLLDRPTGGKLFINKKDVIALSDEEKTKFRLSQLGYVFQEYALIAEFSALENVYLPSMALKGIPDKERAAELLRLVGLGDRLDHYPSELSGGEQQRVAIARALINNPIALLADEPTANLDSTSAKTVLSLFKRLNKDLKQTIVMVTHEPEDKKYVHRVIWLSDGLLEAISKSHSQA
ncbi:ABC transporter ATP-binding protein [Patescibacteria group bacterium]|nr:ABC transporter ATP-binding protein [Patescibacteria group bacterium]